jgi:hypothetical protein
MPVHIRSFLTLLLAFWFLITLLLLSSGPAFAEWVEVADSNQEGMTTYVDLDSIRRKGDLAKMWQLFDFKNVQISKMGRSFLSMRAQIEYDCLEEQSRSLALTVFTDNMGKGGVVPSTRIKESEWEPVAPASMAQRLWKVACGKE